MKNWSNKYQRNSDRFRSITPVTKSFRDLLGTVYDSLRNTTKQDECLNQKWKTQN